MEGPKLSPPTPPFSLSSPPPPSSSGTSFLVLALSILGILTTSVLLLGYYLFINKCRLSWRRSDSTNVRLSLSRTRRNSYNHSMLYSTTIEGRGLEESAIRAIPTVRYKREGEKRESSFHECAVCLNEFQEEERIRLLPNCFHVFHIDCIDTWLQSNANCPLCRFAINACPMSMISLLGPTFQENSDHNSTGDIMIEIREDGDEGLTQLPMDQRIQEREQGRMLCFSSSMGDECIDVRNRERDLGFKPIRRSFSLDSSSDRQLYIALQKILRENSNYKQEFGTGESSSSNGGGSGKLKRSFFSFSNNRCSRSAVLPI